MKIIYKFMMAGLLSCSIQNVQADAASEVQMPGQAERDQTQNNWGRARDAQKGVGELFGHFDKFLGAANSGSDLYDAMKALDSSECVPDLAADASDLMPTSCEMVAELDDMANVVSPCRSCYEKAISRMNNVRKNLARMSCLRMNTKRYVDSAVAFGDNVSGIHGAMGLAWQNQRKGIKAAHEKFKKTYDGKYVEMMGSLDTVLNEISACENQFGMTDWYQKAGFIYFELMKEKYKRTE